MGDSLNNFLSGGQTSAYGDVANGYQNSQNEMNNMYNTGMSGLNPYTQAGQATIPQYQNFLQSIQGQMNGNWMNSYQETPYAKYLTNQETSAANNAAAGGGILGTTPNQQNVAQIANNVTSGDMQNYFNNMQSQNQMQLNGMGQVMGNGLSAAGTGANLSSTMGQAISQAMENMGIAKGNQDIATQSGKNGALASVLGLGGKGKNGGAAGGSGGGKPSGLSGLFQGGTQPGEMSSNYA